MRTAQHFFNLGLRVALTLGLPLKYDRKVDIVQRYHARMQNMKTLPPRFVKDGPILQNVIEGDKNRSNASMAVSEGRLYLRNDEFLYCIGKR